jgi:hypothetical protein
MRSTLKKKRLLNPPRNVWVDLLKRTDRNKLWQFTGVMEEA